MTEASWQKIENLVQGAVAHLSLADQILTSAPRGSLQAEIHRMAALHAIQCGYGQAEEAMERLAEIHGQPITSLVGWRRSLVRNLRGAADGRPPVLSTEMAKHVLTVLNVADAALDSRARMPMETIRASLDDVRAMIRDFPSEIAEYRKQVEAAPAPGL